jgi:methionyl-tRNA formyltransferase
MRAADWARPAGEVQRLVHALSPSPAVAARLGGRLLKILRVAETSDSGPAGRVIALDREGPVVACGAGALVLKEVQPEGKRVMAGADFARGGAVDIGAAMERPWDE